MDVRHELVDVGEMGPQQGRAEPHRDLTLRHTPKSARRLRLLSG
jgi:hypothetical protein